MKNPSLGSNGPTVKPSYRQTQPLMKPLNIIGPKSRGRFRADVAGGVTINSRRKHHQILRFLFYPTTKYHSLRSRCPAYHTTLALHSHSHALFHRLMHSSPSCQVRILISHISHLTSHISRVDVLIRDTIQHSWCNIQEGALHPPCPTLMIWISNHSNQLFFSL